MTRAEAYKILTKYLTDKKLIQHSLATEAAMRSLYKKLTPKENFNRAEEEKWGIVGLLHDADYEISRGYPERHGILLIEKEHDKIPTDIAYAIQAHNYEQTAITPKSLMDWAIATCDQLTGMIIACALLRPDKRIYMVTHDGVLSKFQDKSFAKGVDRQAILRCETTLQLKLPEFIKVVLTGMQLIGKELEL